MSKLPGIEACITAFGIAEASQYAAAAELNAQIRKLCDRKLWAFCNHLTGSFEDCNAYFEVWGPVSLDNGESMGRTVNTRETRAIGRAIQLCQLFADPRVKAYTPEGFRLTKQERETGEYDARRPAPVVAMLKRRELWAKEQEEKKEKAERGY